MVILVKLSLMSRRIKGQDCNKTRGLGKLFFVGQHLCLDSSEDSSLWEMQGTALVLALLIVAPALRRKRRTGAGITTSVQTVCGAGLPWHRYWYLRTDTLVSESQRWN